MGLGLLGAPLLTGAQPATKATRIGILGATPFPRPLEESFYEGLAASGHVPGQNVVVEQRSADRVHERLPGLAAELVRLKSDVILARGPAALAAAAKATSTIPIVAIDLESDPMALGFVKNLSRPGGNVTGVFLDLPELSGKQLQLVREIVPRVSRVAVLGDHATNAAQFRATEQAGATLGLQLQEVELGAFRDVATAFDSVRKGRAEAVIVLSSPVVFADRIRIADFALAKRLPAVSLFPEFAEAGGLMSYGPRLTDSMRRCGMYAGKILAGAKAGDLPIERPEKFDLVINLKTAKALGLTISQLLQLRANQLIR